MSGNDFPSQDTLASALHVSTIDVSLVEGSRKTIESIELRKNNELVEGVPDPICKGCIRRIEFDWPLALNPNDLISVSVNYSWQSRRSKQVADIPIDINLHGDIECMRHDKGGVRLYRKKEKDIEVVVTCQSSLATTTSITQSCSCFRLLIIGNSGVGKTSLIHRVFGVKSVHASETSRGEADINTEFICPKNNRFAIHDSLGLEAGDKESMETVREFIARRKAMPRLEDQLHAVWLCVEVPYAGARLLEAGTEQILQCRDEILGDVPLVVVLTKMDLLDAQSELDHPSNESVEHYASGFLAKYCIGPLHEAAGSDVTYVTVSTLEGYSDSLSKLFRATEENMVKNHVDEAPRIVAAIAQRVCTREKIEASIAVGKKHYQKTGIPRGRALRTCLQVVRTDIIAVWNFDDPDKCLMDDNIIGALLLTDNFGDTPDVPSSTTSVGTLTKLVKNLSMSGHKEVKKNAKTFVAYIVDLICIMQAVFLVASGGRVTAQTVALALGTYQKPRKDVHQLIDAFDWKLDTLPGGRDQVFEKIEEWIWRFSIPDYEIEGLRRRMGRI